MSPGAIIAVGFWGMCGLGVAVGHVCLWVEEKLWARDERRLSALVPSQTVEEMDRRARAEDRLRRARAALVDIEEREQLERMRSGVAFAEAIAATLADIRGLPQTPPVRRSTWS